MTGISEAYSDIRSDQSSDFWLQEMALAIEAVGLKLPQQNPLDQFVHNNLLMPFENEPFWEGVQQASLLYQGAKTKGVEWYFARWKKGLLSLSALEHSTQSYVELYSEAPREAHGTWAQALTLALLKGPPSLSQNTAESTQKRPFLNVYRTKKPLQGPTPVSWPPEVYEWLSKVAETFLDQGMAPWRLREEKSLLTLSRILLEPFRNFRGTWQHDLWECLSTVESSSLSYLAQEGVRLRETLRTSKDWEAWFLRLAFSLRGWSGMIHRMSKNPEIFMRPCQVDLADWLFLLHNLSLKLDVKPAPSPLGAQPAGALQENPNLGGMQAASSPPLKKDSDHLVRAFQELGMGKSSLLFSRYQGHLEALVAFIEGIDREAAEKIWHEAFEWSSYQKVIKKIAQKSPRRNISCAEGLEDVSRIKHNSKTSVQALFCIDDREESLRRHLEEVLPEVKTFGVLGHFGIDMAYVRPYHPRPRQHCPPVIKPRRTLVALPLKTISDPSLSEQPRPSRLSALSYYHFYGSKTVGGGVASAVFFGNLVSFFLLLKGFVPSLIHRFFDAFYHAVIKKNHRAEDKISLERREHPIYGACGYTHEEQADIVLQILRQAGLSPDRLADLIVIMGHTSTSANNPFQQAYGCGACAGNSGGVNARVFTVMLNDPNVRSILRQRGFIIPTRTVAVAAVHDTSRETVFFYKHERNYTSEELKLIDAFELSVNEALDLNASERAPHLGLTLGARSKETPFSGRVIRRKIEQRSLDLAQIRAEFGHSQTHYAYFGPRSSTRGLCLERKSFLISYDSHLDQNGAILRELIHGALPVVANITLDYFFSALDPRGFGSHNKVPLNVSAMIGLVQGSRGDLQVGLAEQMVEIHEPVRPMVFIEAPQDWILDAVINHPRILRLIKNQWIRLVQVYGDSSGDSLRMKLLTPQVTWQDMPQISPGLI